MTQGAVKGTGLFQIEFKVNTVGVKSKVCCLDMDFKEMPEGQTLDEDLKSRDYTVNALYYDIYESKLIDRCKGTQHLKDMELHPIVSCKYIFELDVIRMVRAVRFSEQKGFKMSAALKDFI